MLFDTDVLIWAARGNASAAAVIERSKSRAVSIVSVMELLQGARSKTEMKAIHGVFRQTGFEVYPLTEAIGARAAALIEDHSLSSGLQVCDALIAATAMEHDEALITGNHKHFRAIPKLSVKVFRVRQL